MSSQPNPMGNTKITNYFVNKHLLLLADKLAESLVKWLPPIGLADMNEQKNRQLDALSKALATRASRYEKRHGFWLFWRIGFSKHLTRKLLDEGYDHALARRITKTIARRL